MLQRSLESAVFGGPFRHAVSRKKSDPGDALVLANILRTDMHAHRALPADSDLAHAIAVLAAVHPALLAGSDDAGAGFLLLRRVGAT